MSDSLSIVPCLKTLGFQTLPSPPASGGSTFPYPREGALAVVILGLFDYWLISFALCLFANPLSVDLHFLQNVQIGIDLEINYVVLERKNSIWAATANGFPLGTKRGMNFHAIQRGKRGDWNSSRNIGFLIIVPAWRPGLQTFPSPPQASGGSTFPLSKGSEPLLCLLLGHFDYWLISFAFIVFRLLSLNIFWQKCANWDWPWNDYVA